jgi:dipeptidase E
MARGLPQIVAFGGGGFSMEPGNSLLDDYVAELAGEHAHRGRPRVCFLATASGDADHYICRFYRHFPAQRFETSHISLFRRERGVHPEYHELREHLLTRDLVYVGGGSVISAVGVWRAHGVDTMLHDAWEQGVVMCGPSAGSLCWFAEGISGFHGEPVTVEGLGMLPWSNCVHFDGEVGRRDQYVRALAAGMRPGYACDDGAALHFVGQELARAVASRPRALAYRVEFRGGKVTETALDVRFLGQSALGALDSPLAA